MSKIVFDSLCDKDTFDIAYRLANILKKRSDPVVICLDGDLGVGKTVFAKGIGAGLNIKRDIVSPTFNIVKTYEGDKRLHHFDVYRISDISELDEIGFDEFLFDDALPKDLIRVVISKNLEKGFDYREVAVEGMDDEDFRN